MATSKSQRPSSSSSSSNPRVRYEIFLSFRGEDTRYKFADHLYHALDSEGFKTFRDEDEIQRGDVIKPELREAIMNSRASVIVLSKSYANSTACLFELQTILEHRRKSDHFVYPVFYEVGPGEIKKQSEKLVFEKKEVAVEQVNEWSAALKEIARIAGKVSHGYEHNFIEEIVGELKRKLHGKQLRVGVLGEHLVSMDLRTEFVTLWLKEYRSTKVGILWIRGMGGIGKTTIAKYVFNSNHGRYDAACFLQNIREVAKGQNGLVHLQRQLLKDISRKEEREVCDRDDGWRRMKYVLSNKRVLLVLDDVDHTDQLGALVGEPDWFTPESNIIITTRLDSLEINADERERMYTPKKLSNDESLELFSLHAFGQKYPVQGYMDLSKSFVQHCDGLPIALKVLGSSMRRKNIDIMESELQKLEATSCNTILEKLEISYDSLKDNHDKNLFLDIACFFAGKKKNETITILERCDYSALAGIHNLIDRNLLTIENEKLQMHQLLQDMGKQIVCRESNHPEERSRIWRHMESFSVLSEKIGTKKIEGLVLDMNSNLVVLEANTFEKMYNLRLLKLSGVQFSGTSNAFPKRLRWLYWRGFPSESFPNDFPLENLVALDMRYSNLKQVIWKGTKVLGSLKILNLSHSPKLGKTPDFSRIPNLEKLVLKACPSLFEIHESIVDLQRIESLDLRDCKNLRKLPRNISMVESLVEIDISGCSNLMGAIEELGKMKSLQVFEASRMDTDRLLTMEVESQASCLPWVPKPSVKMSLASLPSSLVRLILSDCNITEDAFPGDLNKLSKLQRLSLSGNPISSLPNSIKDLKGLQTLDLSFCPKLQQIRLSSASLRTLIVQNCDALEEIMRESGTAINLVITHHSNCSELYYVQDSFKILPFREVDEELINSIGFLNLDYMADAEVTILNCLSWVFDKRPIQIMYNDYAFNTFFPGIEVPHWFSNKNSGSTVSFTATLSSHFKFRGLNLCAVYTLPELSEFWLSNPVHFEINSKRSGIKTVYRSAFCGIPEKGGDMVWLSHYFQENMFTQGDEVEVLFMIVYGGQIKECGVHLLYFEEKGEVDQYVSTIQRSWDPNLSPYQPESAEQWSHRATRRILMGAGPPDDLILPHILELQERLRNSNSAVTET